MPECNITYFNLYFDGDKTLYKPGRESTQTQKVPEWFTGPASDNVVYCDLQADKTTAQKTVFETTFLLQDSLRKAKWKITNDQEILQVLNAAGQQPLLWILFSWLHFILTRSPQLAGLNRLMNYRE